MISTYDMLLRLLVAALFLFFNCFCGAGVDLFPRLWYPNDGLIVSGVFIIVL
jgi:hypothetical protein